ncbi:MAG: signal peptide peptidase SppA [Bacteroidales bacterium]|jgi:protease-4|nr:signal peptide peptidase SppA [Bacteroidales bacterium]
MKQFFKFMFASCLGILISAVLFIIAIIGVISAVVASSEPDVQIADNSVLVLNLDKPIYDREVNDFSAAFDVLSGEIDMRPSIGLTEFLEVVKKAKTDDKIKAIMLDVSVLQANGWATVEEMRNALADFKTSGKKVYAYSDLCMQNTYYLLSVADSIYINPAGMIMLTGLGAEVMYFKDMLAKFDIDVDLIRPSNNAYKSAGEPYIANKMSDANREQIKTYLNSIWGHIAANIADSRKISLDVLNDKVANLDAFLPQDALEAKLVDKLTFRTDVEELIAKQVKAKSGNQGKVTFVKYLKYRNSMPVITTSQKENIAIVYAFGEVKQGKGGDLSIGNETLVRAIRKAVDNKRVKAIVLRVNSPGGSAIASEEITNEVIKATKIKPVIVSMGDLAASAGYEISSNATKIVASPTTLTGSIGVFGMSPNFGKLLRNKLGIVFDTVQTHANSVMLSVTKPMSKQGRMVMQRNVENFYQNFIEKVAQGRGLKKDFVDSIARGRVWTGADAKALGLVDEIGGLNKAIETAAKQANLKSYGIVSYPSQKDFVSQILNAASGNDDIKLYGNNPSKASNLFRQLQDISEMQGVQKRLPFVLTIE